jgi:hypothetical protein
VMVGGSSADGLCRLVVCRMKVLLLLKHA